MTNDFCKHIMRIMGVNLYYFPVFLLADSTVPVVFGLCVAVDGAVPLRICFFRDIPGHSVGQCTFGDL